MNVEKKRRLAARTEMMLIGNLLMGTAVGFLRMSRFGTDPFTCMNLGVSGTLRIQFGTYQLLVNVLLFLLVLVKAKDCIGAGTIVNMAGIGYIADIIVVMLTKAVGDGGSRHDDGWGSGALLLRSGYVYGGQHGNRCL